MFSDNLLQMNYNVIRETVDEINDKYFVFFFFPDKTARKLSWNVFYRPKV